jgi:hypothetical protein
LQGKERIDLDLRPPSLTRYWWPLLYRNTIFGNLISKILFCNATDKGKGKGKTVPLQAWSGPEGSRKLRLPDFMTTAQDGGKVVSLTHRPSLPPGNTPGTHFC